MATASDAILIDTNVLVYAMNSSAAEHPTALAFLDRALRGEFQGLVTAQILVEYVAVVTNPRHVTRPLSADDAADDARRLATALSVLPVPADLLSRVLDRAATLGIGGRHIFDLQHAVMAEANGVTKIATYDTRFRNFYWIEAVTPQL